MSLPQADTGSPTAEVTVGGRHRRTSAQTSRAFAASPCWQFSAFTLKCLVSAVDSSGPDVFFIISGFVITGQLSREVSTTGTIKLRPFYGARARRLLPVSAAIGVVIVIASAILLPPLQAKPVVGDGIACALYVGDYSSSCAASTTSPPTCRPRHSSTTGLWVSRSSSTCFGRP